MPTAPKGRRVTRPVPVPEPHPPSPPPPVPCTAATSASTAARRSASPATIPRAASARCRAAARTRGPRAAFCDAKTVAEDPFPPPPNTDKRRVPRDVNDARGDNLDDDDDPNDATDLCRSSGLPASRANSPKQPIATDPRPAAEWSCTCSEPPARPKGAMVSARPWTPSISRGRRPSRAAVAIASRTLSPRASARASGTAATAARLASSPRAPPRSSMPCTRVVCSSAHVPASRSPASTI